MINIYETSPAGGYELCHPVKGADFEQVSDLINGTSRKSNWHPIRVRLIRKDMGRKLTEADAPWLGSHALIFRRRAVELLNPMLEADGELLPLACAGAELWMYNPLRVLDALDEANSSVARLRSGRIFNVYRYIFLPEVIGGAHIFKLSCFNVSSTYVTQSFVDAWQANGLRGLAFEKVTGKGVS